MKKKIKNRELELILSGANHLGGYAMPGDLTLAVISARKELSRAFELYNEASKEIGEARCQKDDGGKIVTEYQRDLNGNEITTAPKKLKFVDAASEFSALEELKKLGEQEIEIDVREFDSSVLESLANITPIQMEALDAMISTRRNRIPEIINN